MKRVSRISKKNQGLFLFMFFGFIHLALGLILFFTTFGSSPRLENKNIHFASFDTFIVIYSSMIGFIFVVLSLLCIFSKTLVWLQVVVFATDFLTPIMWFAILVNSKWIFGLNDSNPLIDYLVLFVSSIILCILVNVALIDVFLERKKIKKVNILFPGKIIRMGSFDSPDAISLKNNLPLECALILTEKYQKYLISNSNGSDISQQKMPITLVIGQPVAKTARDNGISLELAKEMTFAHSIVLSRMSVKSNPQYFVSSSSFGANVVVFKKCTVRDISVINNISSKEAKMIFQQFGEEKMNDYLSSKKEYTDIPNISPHFTFLSGVKKYENIFATAIAKNIGITKKDGEI